MGLLAFSPNTTASVGLTTTQSNVTLGGNGHYIRCVNGGTGNAYLQFYEAAQAPPTVAALTSMLLPPGAIEVFSVPSDTTRVAALGDATGTTLSLTRGEGQ
jgi:hypothetical protein